MSLTNNDFRQLLNEADASVLASTKQHRKKQQQQRTPGQISEAQIRRRERYKEILKRKQLRAQKDEGDNKGNAYRDRAEERRKQKESFYAHVADELAELKERTVEESKFLGGDVDHTHLVKGLDVVLLNKVRAELNKEQQRQAAAAAAAAAAGSPAADGQQQQRRPLAANPNLRKALQLLLNGLHPHAVRFAEKLKHMELRLLAS
ncbi:hypothetical protein, conserved [Eimeria necatrix]|uniref:RED-like N-terminal domain-containing protein n=1 Tax=Eimeria necatrix TaxID=51315 RepID=U6MW40_9EIME|nr:hypothetical protein, conserved [Eimeria necatrix]CDJ68477.1 hypothetical protein, conserved [Eimeria necatrix]